ncbi:carboxypeptidase-like regulatory domain-containing protein [Kordia sp. YSTF-M3]|uniref:Carboxypeptidase-like regulatory domain-containing protein n=1 Tax=Kordia aestuariivivens TaxID=2759037 RepID=A0ABR7QAZ2_9FLAO|nr:carboxypeptidase-like regulatory domain-containing protein [Kordia aestuariivivens]MBC8755741.1 carboxypeptidase-like regulatory domain-containing protein [Kordia aestuariivivens]
MKSTLLFTLFFSITFFGFAQSNTISGTVYDEDKNVLADANVIVKNSKEGKITGKKGQFAFDAHPKDTLVISYLGFETKEIIIGDQKEFSITLNSEWEKLEAVTIVAYGGTICSSKWCCCPTTMTSETVSEDFKRISTNESLTSLFPNPSANGLFQLQLDKTYNTITVEVFNMNGQLIQTKTHTKLSKIPQIDLSTQPKGIYLIRTVVDGNILETKKAVKS